MGTYLRPVKLDEMIAGLAADPVLINEIDTTTLEGKELFNRFLISSYIDGDIDISMSCACGLLVRSIYHGKRCPHCHTVVLSKVDRVLENRLWFPKPESIEAIFNPVTWMILDKYFTINKTNLIAYFCDRSIPLEIANKSVVAYIESLPFERGFNNFVNNFDAIIEALVVPKTMNSRDKRAAFMKWYNEYKDDIFVNHIALPSREFMVLEQSGQAKFAQKTNISAIDAIRTLASLDTSVTPLTETLIERRLVRFYEQITSYYNGKDGLLSEFIGSKKGIARKHIFGDILAWTGRGVIVSITKPHFHNEIELPMGIAIRMLKFHITSILARKFDMSPNQMKEKIERAVTVYDKDIDDIIKEIIATSDLGGIPLLLGRNPTISRGSLLFVICRVVKTDMKDTTISLSILVTRFLNADKVLSHLLVIVEW